MTFLKFEKIVKTGGMKQEENNVAAAKAAAFEYFKSIKMAKIEKYQSSSGMISQLQPFDFALP